MKKNLLLRLCLILVVAITAHSCRTDQFPEQETFNNSSKFQLTSKRISLNESKHKEKLVTELNKVEAEFKAISKSNVNGKIINYGNGVSIDTDQVTYIENGSNFHTYTFSLTRENALPTDPVENLVLIPATDGTYREMLISYNLSPQEKQLILDGEHVDTKGKTTVTILDGNTYNPLNAKSGQSCVWMEAVVGFTACSQNAHFNGEGSSECDAKIKSQAIKEFFLKCTSISSGTETGGGWWAGSGGGTDNGGGGTQEPGNGTTEPCNGNGVATNPVDPNTNIGVGGCEGIPTVIEMPTIETPCEKIVKVGKDHVTKAAMIDLKTKVNDNKEHIYLLWENNVGVLQDDIQGTGPENGGGINFNFNSGDKFSALLHSHYDRPDMLSIFSFDDFISVCNLVYFNAIKDQNSFVIGVVTASGTQYMMVIDDPAKLATFASQMFVNGVFDEKTASDYEDFYNGSVYSTNTIEKNELGLALFLESQNIGLKLMKGDDQMENWQQFTKNKQGNIVPVNCN